MSILVLVNLGLRDVRWNGKQIEPARTEGRRLLEEYPSCAAQLSFPIVEPMVRYLLTHNPGETIDLYLFGTDQPDPKFQPSDTLYFTRLMARRLPEVLGDKVRTHTVDVKGFNPSYYDRAYQVYGRLLADLPAGEEVKACYAALTGGTPACNTALLLQGVRRYGDHLKVLYTPIGGEPIPIGAGEQILGSFREAAALERLAQLDFIGALPLMRSLGVSDGLCHLAEYAARRLDFDFQSASRALESGLAKADNGLRDFILQTLWHDLDLLLEEETSSPARLAALLRELNWNAAICWRHRRYADFLARVYRFQEAVLRYLVERIFGLPTDLAPNAAETTQRLWEEGIRARPKLLEHLESSAMRKKNLDWRNIGRPVYKAMLSFAVKEQHSEETALGGQERLRYAALLKRVNALDRLVELRHRTIVGHDFKGVSEETLLQASPRGEGSRAVTPDQALDDITCMVAADANLDIARHSPYEQIAEYLRTRLRQGAV